MFLEFKQGSYWEGFGTNEEGGVAEDVFRKSQQP